MAEETLQMGRALAEAEAPVDEQYELSSDDGLPFWITWIGYRATSARIGLVHFMTELAETLLAARDTRQGMAVIDEAQANYARTGNSYHAADLHRVRGELLIACARVPEGEARLVHALGLAREHGARSLELRALTSLARRSPEWLAPLRTAREAIIEGGDTIDLRHADELLGRVRANS